MLGYILFLFGLLNVSYFYSKVTKKSIEIATPIVFFIQFFMLYLSGIIFNSFIVGIYTIQIIFFVSIIYNSYLFIKNPEELKKTITPFFKISFIYFTILITFKGFQTIIWDDFSHWVLVVKNMSIVNNLVNRSDTTVIFKTYPPATATLQYFFNYLQNKFYNFNLEYNTQVIMNFFTVVLLLSMISMKKYKNNLIKITSFLILVLIPAILNDEVYLSLYVDSILGILGAYIISYYEYSKKLTDNNVYLKIFEISMAVCFLVLTKATGTAIAIFCIIYIVFDLFIGNSMKLKFIYIISILLSLVISKKSWNYYLILTKTKNIWETNKINFESILEIINKKAPAYRYEVIRNFLRSIFEKNIKIIPFIYLALIILIILLIKYIKEKNLKTLNFLFYNMMILIIYPVSLLIMYLFIFSEIEAVNLASYSRYMSTILIFLLIVIFLRLMDEHFFKKNIFIVSIIVLILFFTNNIPRKILKKNKRITQTSELRDNIKEIPNGILKDKNPKIYFVSTSDDGFYYLMFRYTITPLKTQSWYYDSSKDLNEEFKNYQYIYLHDYNLEFLEKYNHFFSENIEKKKYYKVSIIGNNIQLYKID